jgi:hypothetical protein
VGDTDSALLVGATTTGAAGGQALAVHARVSAAALRSMILAYATLHRGVLDALAALS